MSARISTLGPVLVTLALATAKLADGFDVADRVEALIIRALANNGRG
ncbi:MAG: hypothetical protein ACJ8BF_10210 [Gemmatimonadales bacterium]